MQPPGKRLLDYVSERSRVVPHPDIASDNRHQLWRLAEQLCRCEMHRIERTDRFERKCSAHASEHRSIDIDDETAPLERAQGTNGGLFIGWRQPPGGSRPDDRPACLRKGQSGRHVPRAGRRLQNSRVMLQQRGNQRTRLNVANARSGCFRPTGTWSDLPDRAPARNATRRHDRCRSVQRRFPAAAGYPASPRTDHQLRREVGDYRPQ